MHCARRLSIFLIVALLSLPLAAQPALKALTGGGVSTVPAAKSDPLGRNTPRGCLTGFMEAAQKGDIERAAEYLQLPRAETEFDSQRVVSDLKTLLDHAYVGRLGAITDNPEIAFDPQLEPNHQRVGEFTVNGRELPLLVVRVPDGNSGHIWLVAWSTLGKSAEFASDARSHEVERRLPTLLVQHKLLSIPLWVWAAFLLLIPLALLAGLAAVALVGIPAWLLSRANHHAARSEIWHNIRGPVLLFAAGAAHAIGMKWINTPLLFREYYIKVQGTAMLFALAWLLWDLVTVWTARMRRRLIAPEERGTLSLTMVLHRLLKAAIVTCAVLGVLHLVGFELSAVLAGLGIGGIAVALAAQKTIENLFGGISLLSDRVMRVGDLCRVGEHTGTVEDIGLRSTRIRTYERGLVSIPNGALATARIENLSSRDKIRIYTTFGLAYGNSREQLQQVLSEINAMLHAHPKVERSSAWVRLARFAESALELEMQAYVLTRDYDLFLATREELFLRIMEIVEGGGSALAVPARHVHFSGDSPAPAAAPAAFGTEKVGG